MNRVALLIALAVCVLPCQAGGLLDPSDKTIDDYTLEVEGRYWFATLSGEIQADTSLLSGSKIDFPDELDFEEPADPLIEGVAYLRLKKIQVRAAYFQVTFDESKRLEKTIRFKDLVFTAGTTVDAQATVRFGALDAGFLIVDAGSSKEIGLEVAIGIGGRYLGLEAAIQNALTGIDEDVSKTGLIPVVSASASVAFLNCFKINVEAAGMHIGGFFPKIQGTFIDAAIEARVYLASFIYVAGGYRFILLDARWDSSAELKLEAKLQGWFVGVGLTF
ncbi:MAG: hypothetical protein FD180_3533 [Planctomycetota bacterium]|nr:MAG: hypothetical protein FD180_3533 [Planctomycetota bacterium]